MSDLATILTRVKAVVDAVVSTAPDSRVHIGERQFNSREHWLAVGLDPGWAVPHLHLWVVRRGPSAEDAFTLNTHLRKTTITIEGWYQVFDETDDPSDASIGTTMPSESSFSGLVEHVCDHLRNDAQLHGVVCVTISPPTVAVWNTETLDESECHHAVITFTASEEKLVSLT